MNKSWALSSMCKTAKVISSLLRVYSGPLSSNSCLLRYLCFHLSSPGMTDQLRVTWVSCALSSLWDSAQAISSEGNGLPAFVSLLHAYPSNVSLRATSSIKLSLISSVKFESSFSNMLITLCIQSYKLAKKYVSPPNYKLFEDRGHIFLFFYPYYLPQWVGRYSTYIWWLNK